MHAMTKTNFVLWGFLAVSLLILIEPAWATQTASMPWDTALTKIKNAITGPVAMVIALLAIVVAGVSLIFGSEFSDFVRKLLMLALVLALVVAASSFLTALFTVGATVS